MTTFRENIFWAFGPTWCLKVCKNRICLYMLLYVPFLDIQNDFFQENKCFDPTQGVESVCKDIICACMVHCAPFLLIWYALRILKKKYFDLWPQPSGRACVCKDRICACMVFYALFTFIRYETRLFSEKNEHLTPPQDLRVCACIVLCAPFPFIWYATWLLSEKIVLTFDPSQRVVGVCKDATCLHGDLYSFLLTWYATWLLSVQIKLIWLLIRVCVRADHVLACCCVRYSV